MTAPHADRDRSEEPREQNVPPEGPAHDGWAPLGLDDQGRSLGSTRTTASVTVPLQPLAKIVRERYALRAEIADRESERADLRDRLDKAEAEVERLRRWKAEATEVILGLQDVGKALGLRLGELITGASATEAAERLTTRAEAAESALAEERARIKAALSGMEAFARLRATASRARAGGGSPLEREWLDMLILIERAALAGPAQPADRDAEDGEGRG